MLCLVAISIQLMACRYHHNSFFAQEVGVVVREVAMEKFTDYIQLMFDNQDSEFHAFSRQYNIIICICFHTTSGISN